ncbi:MAG TPA: MFS transporter [Candidatus Limnocylindrales bacterium]
MTATTATTPLTDLDRLNHRKVARAGWALYDLADTIWSYAIFSRAISLFLVDKLGDGPGNLWLGLSVALSVGVNALVSPFLGAVSDRYGRRLPFLLGFTLGACLPAMLIPFVPVPLGILLFCVAMFSYQSCLIYYDATLQLVSTPENRGRIASLSTGVGYMGTVLIALLLLVSDMSVERTFVVAPILFLVFAAPTFILLKEDPSRRRRDADPLGAAWSQTWRTIRSLDQYPGLGRFLASRFFYTDALNTSVTIMTIFAVKAVGFTETEANIVLLVLTLSAIVSSFIWGRLVDRNGPKRTLFSVLALWAVALIVGAVLISPVPFLIAGLAIGAGFSGLHVSDRVLMYRLSPPERLGEFYGLYGLVGKGSQVIGNLFWGVVLFVTFDTLGKGAYQLGIFTLLIAMLIGLFLLYPVPEKREG